jgi:hypothetical protein
VFVHHAQGRFPSITVRFPGNDYGESGDFILASAPARTRSTLSQGPTKASCLTWVRSVE